MLVLSLLENLILSQHAFTIGGQSTLVITAAGVRPLLHHVHHFRPQQRVLNSLREIHILLVIHTAVELNCLLQMSKYGDTYRVKLH